MNKIITHQILERISPELTYIYNKWSDETCTRCSIIKESGYVISTDNTPIENLPDHLKWIPVEESLKSLAQQRRDNKK